MGYSCYIPTVVLGVPIPRAPNGVLWGSCVSVVVGIPFDVSRV